MDTIISFLKEKNIDFNEDCKEFKTDFSLMEGKEPFVCVEPERSQVRSLLNYLENNDLKYKIRGNGTDVYGNTLSKDDFVLVSTDKIRKFETNGDKLTVGSGMCIEQIKDRLDSNYNLVVEPTNQKATIGGLIETGGIGKGSAMHGLLKDNAVSERCKDMILESEMKLLKNKKNYEYSYEIEELSKLDNVPRENLFTGIVFGDRSFSFLDKTFVYLSYTEEKGLDNNDFLKGLAKNALNGNFKMHKRFEISFIFPLNFMALKDILEDLNFNYIIFYLDDKIIVNLITANKDKALIKSTLRYLRSEGIDIFKKPNMDLIR